MDHHHDDDHHQGLSRDLETLTRKARERRQVLRWLTSTGMLALAGCGASTETSGGGGSGGSGGSGGAESGGGGSGGAGSCSEIPEETAGPYPGDGSNGVNALTLSGIVRSDIRSSIDGASGTAEGVQLTVTLTILDKSDCSPIAGRAVYLWHCNQAGEYSMYSAAIADENYLRGVQETDENGQVTFTTIFPGCYDGRWPHMHFEVYPSLDEATDSSNKLATSQLAMPEAACNEVYATSGYEASVENLANTSLTSDNVFGDDGAELQLAAVSEAAEGYLATLTVSV